jgi:hypothetical protein
MLWLQKERECCLLVLNSVTSTPQWIRQLKQRTFLRACVREEDAGGREAGAPSDLTSIRAEWTSPNGR